MFAQILLVRLRDKYDAKPLQRLSRELEIAAKRKGNPAMIDLIHAHTSTAPLELAKTINSILSSSTVMPGDVANLKRFYSSVSPPSSSHLCNYDLIVKLLKSLYVPQDGILIKPELVDDVTYLIAYATTFNDSKTREVQNTKKKREKKVLNSFIGATKGSK